MSSIITAQEVLDEVAFRTHVPTFASGEFVTVADGIRLLKSSLRRLSGFLASISTADLLVRTDTLVVPADEAGCTLPLDVETLRTVHWQGPDGRLYELRRGHPQGDGGALETAATDWSGCDAPTYWLEGGLIRLSGAPLTQQSLVVTYTHTLTIVDSTSEIVVGQGWEEWLVCDMCERIRGREQKDASDFTAAKAEAAAIIQASVLKRDRFAMHSVRDVSETADWSRRYRRWL